MSKAKPKPRSTACQNVATVSYQHNGKHLTNQAGMMPVLSFLKAFGLLTLLAQFVVLKRGPQACYSLAEAVRFVWIGLLGGARSLDQAGVLWSDGVLARLGGWRWVPDAATVGRIFRCVGQAQIEQLKRFNHAARQRIWCRGGRAGRTRIGYQRRIVVDVDSTAKTVYGQQEGAVKGYNTHKRGGKCYQALLAFCAETKEILQGWLRPGNTYTSAGIVQFMTELLTQLPGGMRVFFRADSGFFSGDLLDFLEAGGHGYLIKVKLKNLTNLLAGQTWQPIPGQPGWEQCEFDYQARSWSRARRFKAVRVVKETKIGEQQVLFTALEYEYFCYVTSEAIGPWETHKQYGQRATSETWIEEAKNQMGLGHIKTKCFLANAALFQCAILAYNTLRWMALLSGNKELRRWEPKTVRMFLIRVAGQLLTGGRQLKLKLPDTHLHPGIWRDWLALGQQTWP